MNRRDFLFRVGAALTAAIIPIQTTAQRVAAEVTKFSQGGSRFRSLDVPGKTWATPIQKSITDSIGYIENRSGQVIAYVDRQLLIHWSGGDITHVFQRR